MSSTCWPITIDKAFSDSINLNITAFVRYIIIKIIKQVNNLIMTKRGLMIVFSWSYYCLEETGTSEGKVCWLSGEWLSYIPSLFTKLGLWSRNRLLILCDLRPQFDNHNLNRKFRSKRDELILKYFRGS
jgi:hypothetical protein